MKDLKMCIIVILAAVCLGMEILDMTQNNNELIMAVYRRGWVDGANASTGCTNTGIIFGPKIAEDLFKVDSLKIFDGF